MPNYRQKNKKNKNKNRQKNQQQQQQLQSQNQQQNNKSKNQNQNQQEEQQQPQQQSTIQNRHSTAGTKDNQNQGRRLRPEQSNIQQKAPKSPTVPITTSPTPLDSEDAPSPPPHTSYEHASSHEDARKVDTTGHAVVISATAAAANVKCHNLNSNDTIPHTNAPTIHHQVNETAVHHEVCNRKEDGNANAHQTKLDNTTTKATYNEIARSEKGEVKSDVAAIEGSSTMGNKDSKTTITSDCDENAVVNAATDASGTSISDRNISTGSGELDELQTVVSKTQMAKVIVHRLVHELSERGQEEVLHNGGIVKDAKVAEAGDKIEKEMANEEGAWKMNKHKGQEADTKLAARNVEKIGRKVRHEEKKQEGIEAATNAHSAQQSKVIIHMIEQEEGEDSVTEDTEKQKRGYSANAQQKQVSQTAKPPPQSSEGNKAFVHKIPEEVTSDGVVAPMILADRHPSINQQNERESISEQLSADPKVIVHHIQLESTSPPHNYHVELPDADSPTSPVGRGSKQSILNKSIVHIQELSDESASSECNDNPPVISEAESETESIAGACALDYSQQIRTLSPDSEENYELVGKPQRPSPEQHEHKQRRAQKRVALESHFLPQLLSPRYLDSIVEENSDMSDARSDCSENPLMTTYSGDDLRDGTAAKVRKANEIFPRSNLDFSRRHAKKPLGALPKKSTSCIREEPVAMVVAAKLIDDATASAQECCTRLSSEHTPESEAAEIIYLSSSASSSLSDLLELDAEVEGGDIDEGDSCRTLIDLDTDVREIITKPGGGGEEETVPATAASPTNSDSRESTPVNQGSVTTTTTTQLLENINDIQKMLANNNNNSSVSDQKTAAPIGTNIDVVIANNNATITNHQHIESRIYENLKSLQLLALPNDERATLSTGESAAARAITTPAAAAADDTTTTTSESETDTELSSETTTTTTTERCEYLRSSDSDGNVNSNNSSSSIISSIESKYPLATLATSDSLNVDPAVLLENIELEMNNVREILNSHTTDDSTVTTYGCGKVNDTRSSELNILANYHNNSANKASSPSPPPIPPPPTSASASDFHSDFTDFPKTQTPTQTQSQSESSAPPPPIPTRTAQLETHNFTTTHTTETTSPQTTNSFSSIKSALNSLSLLGRQESTESHCSDSTQHSQCTAINVGSRPHNDDLELTPSFTANSPISDDPQQKQQRDYLYNDWKYTSAEGNRTPTNLTHTHRALEEQLNSQNDAPIKKLRLLCTETLASMPYGEQVLVELATVAQNISELQAKTPTTQEKNLVAQQKLVDGAMPYPLPQLPHISELQLSIGGDEPSQISSTPHHHTTSTPTTHTVTIKQHDSGEPERIVRDFTSAKILHSPPAPPVPTSPSHYSNGREGGGDAPWLGVPTTADPNVLVCLSPAQQKQLTAYMSSHQSQSSTAGHHLPPQPDQLLDAHQKFQERRGYHEFSEEQVKSLNAEMQKEEEQILKMAAYMKKLRKSLTPPPPPVPPPPVPSKSSETAAKARTVSSAAAIISSIGSSAYDATTKYRTANAEQQQRTVTFANGEEEEHELKKQKQQTHNQNHLQTLIQNTGKPADAIAFSVAGSSSSYHHQPTSSLENNSRQSSGAQGSVLDFAGKQPNNSADFSQYSNANASEATSSGVSHNLYDNIYQQKRNNSSSSGSFPTSSARMQGVESELAKMFPSMGSNNIFDSERKRFSNIESSTSTPSSSYCAQLQSTLPKRYSNIETHSYEAKKRMENGQVVYDYSDSHHDRQSDGDKSLQSASTPSLMLHFPVKETTKETQSSYPVAGDSISHRSENSEIMSAIKLNTTTTNNNAKTNVEELNKTEASEKEKEKANGINMTNFHYSGVPIHNSPSTAATSVSSSHCTDHKFSKTTTEETTIREENINKNSQVYGGAVHPTSSGGDGSGSKSAFEEFRQNAKADAGNERGGVYGVEAPATAPPLGESKHSAFNFQHDKLFKDFDTLSQQLHTELEQGKAQREQREKSASLYDLSRTQWNFKDHFEQLKKERHEHMKELEREIDRSMRSRQLKGWANGSGQTPNTSAATATGRTFDIPIRIEQRKDIPANMNSNDYAYAGGNDRSSAQPRAYNIPIEIENGAAPTRPPPQYDTVDDASRFRRAESMFNLSDNARRPQTQAQHSHAAYERPQSTAGDDWARYASDFGSSENITRPFAREVEICYQRQRPRTIRAPRLSASTNDLSSSTQSYDTYNAYNVRRTHAPMLQSVSKQQQQRPHHASCYSVLERDPNPTYISTTTRRGVSPAPVSQAATQEPPYSPVVAPERQRRASLPREIQEQQLKYISSKEEELRMEFDRLQNERRRVMEELNTTPTTLQMPQHPMRDIYRPVPKLPTLTEDEVFRQQMAEEWLNKVAEREERRLQKIIKISKVNEGQQGQHAPAPPHHKPDISDEFLKRVHERRTKLAMPADSDWESGAESQPVAPGGHASESEAEGLPVKVIEGKSEADLRQLPRHLREFARFSNHNEEKIDGGHRVVHQEEERRQEANANSMSSALKKSSVVKTVKIARHPEIVGEPSHRVPTSVQQQHNHHHQQQQGHYRTTSGGEQEITRRSNIATSTSSTTTRSIYERHTKLQRKSREYGCGRGGEGVCGNVGVINVKSRSVSDKEPTTSLNKQNADNNAEHSHYQCHSRDCDHHHHHHSHKRQQSTNYSNTSQYPAPQMRSTCKKTRFLLEPNRRSWSESDLLKEIDSELKLAKGFLYANEQQTSSNSMFTPKFKATAPIGSGIWTPGTQTPNTSLTNLHDIHPKVSTPTPPPPPSTQQLIWTPQPSPSSGRKEFRPVRFESPTLSRRYVHPQNNEGTPPAHPPWRQSTATTDGDSSYAAPSTRSAYSCTNVSTPTTTIGSAGSTNYCDSIPSESSLLNQLSTGPSRSVADKIKTFERSASTSALYSPAARRRNETTQPFYKPNEVIFKVKHEYMSEPETEHDLPRKMAQLGRRQVDGIGPVTNDGMPIILRSEVKEPHQHEWYKRLYQTIHKQKNGGNTNELVHDYVIRYKCPRARPTLKSTGYQSEPEPNYDSDYSTVKYRTLDRRRLQSVSSATNVANRNQDHKIYGTMPNPIKSAQNTYKNQPGRIEDYVTGRSSVSEKERKEWWDEVMDIFNGHLDQAKLSPHYTEGNLSRALAKDSGYTSDSNLVFRKCEIPQPSPLSPVEQKQAYKSVQAGGEPPLFGFRKPAPERPKEFLDYTQFTPTLTRAREISASVDKIKEAKLKTIGDTYQNKLSSQQVTYTKVHHQAKMFTPSFIQLGDKRSAATPPPRPPNRKSSCQRGSTSKASPARQQKPTHVISKRHEQCFQSPDETVLGVNKYATLTIRKHGRVNGTISRSKSAGAVSSLLSTASKVSADPSPRALSICRGDASNTDGAKIKRIQQHTRFRSVSPTRPQGRLMTLRQSSRSPVAFGRSISKERTFAEEKKRLENSLPTGFTNFEASTNILRDPSLKSPQEVKQAVRSYATCAAHLRSKSMPRLRDVTKRPDISTVSTTVRHTTCFPQAQIIDCAKAVRKSLTRAKSPHPKTVSTISLTRTDSTFSVDSAPTKGVSKTKLAASKKVAETKTKKESKPVKIKSIAKQNSNRLEVSAKENIIPKTQKMYTALKSQPSQSAYCAREESRTIPRSGFQSISLHQSRSLSPKRYYHLEEYNARLGDYDDIDRSYVDDLLWQYEHCGSKNYPSKGRVLERSTGCDIARPESPRPDLKSRKFSPTREIRVPQEPRSLQATYDTTESPKVGTDPSFTSSSEHYRKFSPTRQMCVPKLPPSLQPSLQRVKSPKSIRDIARPESPAVVDTPRRFSPTREVRVPQLPHSLPRTILKSASAQPVRDTVRVQSSTLSRKFSPTREVRIPQESSRSVRSPSRRRIETYRASTSKGDKIDVSKVIRASSLSSADDRSRRGLYLCGELAHSATSLEHYERHSPTCRYRNNSERFTDLNRFYSTLERVGQLERATSLTSFKPIRKDGEPLGFNEWRKVRNHERAEKELHFLVGKLKKDQRTKDFVFRPKDVEDVKWRKDMDFGLHSKDKSVEDLRYEFEQKNIFADYEQQLRQEYDGTRDYVRPYWRRNTVADLASSLEVKVQPESVDLAAAEELAKCQLGSRLVSTLSKDQVLKITQQLNEIYAGNAHASTEDYVITVDADTKKRTAPNTLKVRCNSTMTKDDLLQPMMSKKYTKEKMTIKEQSKDKSAKGEISLNNKSKGTRSTSPVYLARETRGAVAAKNAEEYLPKPPPPPPIPQQPEGKLILEQENINSRRAEDTQATVTADSEDVRYDKCNGNAKPKELQQAEHSPERPKEPKEKITQKIQYFEERQYAEPPKTIYHAREDSSPDEAEVMRAIEENIKTRAQNRPTPTRQHRELSTSLTDLKDIFGERHTARVNFHMHSPPERPPDIVDASPRSPPRECMEVSDAWYDLGDLTPNSSVEMLNAHYRSRSLSPDSQASSSYLCRVHTGDVRKIKEHFENFGTSHEDSRCHFFGISTLRKVRSDPELKQQFNEVSKDALKTIPTSEEYADVASLAHKFEQRSQSMRLGGGRGRQRRRVISPICVRDRLMPHIDVISKTASLQDTKKATQRPNRPTPERSFVVERIRNQYERSLSPPTSNRRHTTSTYISNSSPDIPRAAAISPHLSADWIAHKYPSPTQNAYKGIGIEKSDSKERTSTRIAKVLRRMPQRSSSASPPRPPKLAQHHCNTMLRNFRELSDVFANQQFDPKKHQPKARYVPDGAEATERKRATSHSRCGGSCEILKSAMAVSFQDDGSNPPVPPQPSGYRAESPNRYLESDVNIHFKTPIRHEYKQAMSDEELAQRQAEQMQKLYQEERRRKYLQELQDMNARRHTDNFTPTQKSPIPLNRYDDFQSDLAPKSPNTITTRTAARALYNFQGQNARELSFKKGDIIYIRRQIDRNWYEGEHNAMIGLLPVSYVEIIHKETARQQQKKPSEGQARAKYNFQAQSGIELSLNKGELVTLTRRVDDNWFEGKVANRKGIFPVSYVEVLTDIGAEDIAARTVTTENVSVTNLRPSLDTLRTNINNEFNLITKNGHQPPNGILKETKHNHNNNKIDALHVDTHSDPLVYRALYKYRPQNSDEMELLEGDIVHVLEICDDGWFVGTSQRTGCFGTFPGNYVERVL